MASGDPIALGFISSLARPGGNVTGTAGMTNDLAAKRLQLLTEAVPQAKQIAVLFHPDDPVNGPAFARLRPPRSISASTCATSRFERRTN